MLYKTKCAVAIKGTRIEKGAEVDLKEEDFAQFDINDFALVGADIEEAPEEAPVAIEDMTAAQLKVKATELGLVATGTKADLLERITLHLQD